MKKKFFGLALVLILVIVLFSVRQSDLTIHLLQESKTENLDITLSVDGEIIFQDSVQSNMYLGEKVVVKDLGIGFHEIIVSSDLGEAKYSKNDFYLFNRTVVFRYFDEAADCESPCFDVLRTFGKFLSE